MRANPASAANWHGNPSTNHSGELTYIGVSQLAPTDLSTTLSGPTTALAGQTITYTATTTNAGASAAGTQTTLTLPSKPAMVTTTGSYNATTGVITFTNGTVAPGATVTNTVSFVALGASVTGQAASTTTSTDANPSNNDGSAANANITTTLTPTGAAGTPAPCATAGKDGAATPLSTNPNAYYPSTAAQSPAVNATTITVGPARGAATSIAPGDLLLIIQMQGADINSANTDSYGDGVAGGAANGSSAITAGTYEYVTVAAASATVTAAAGGTITLATGLKNSYANTVATATKGQRTFQVIRVPQYTNVTLGANITPSAWNGATGGIVAIDVDGQLNLAGFTIDASGMGFRGGAGRQLRGDNSGTTSGTDYRSSVGLNTGGTKGEGIVGTPRYINDPAYAAANGVFLDTRTATAGYPTLLPAARADGYPSGDNGRGAPGNAGGGGTDANPVANDENTGGGGGANGGDGGRGGNSWNSNSPVGGEPGAAFPVPSSSRLVLGGGGGAGATNDGTGTPAAGFASSGAAGGGMVLVRTGTLTGTGNILANGANANNTVANDGSGGGGSGGSILVTVTNSQSATLTLTANGGTGGTNSGGGVSHGPGGGGGGGIILTNSTATATAMANGGANGTTNPNPGPAAYGSTPGQVGIANPAISNSIANSTAGASCIADVATTITGPVNANAGSTATLNVTYSNIGSQTANGVTQTVTLPAGLTGVTATGGTISGSVLTGYTITYSNPTLAAGASNAYVITYTVPASGTVTATSNTSTTTSEGGLTANNTSSVTTTVGLVADVTTTLAGPTVLNAGQPSGTYTVAFTNNGPSTASVVTQQVTLPTGVTNVIVPSGATYTPATRVIDFGAAATLTSGATNQFNFSFTAPTTTGAVTIASAVGTATNQGANTANDNASLVATVNTTANVATTISAGAASVLAGQTGTFNVTFSNSGPQTAAGVVAAVQLPAGLTNVVATNGGVYNSTTGVVSYSTLTSQASGASTASAITFTVPATGPVTATATTSTTTNEAGQTANNVASASIGVTPTYDVTTTISGPTTTAVGVQTTFSVSTANNGPSVAPSVVQTVTGLPTNLSNVYVSNGGTYNAAIGTVTFPALATLANGARADNTISFTPTTTTGFTATATVAANINNTGDSNTANNTAAAPATTVNAAPAPATNANLYTTITNPSANVAPGATTTFTVTSGNSGAGTATTVAQFVTLPAGLSGVVVKDGAGTVIPGAYNATTGLVTFPTVASLGSSASKVYTIDITAPASGVIAAVATISAATADLMPSNNIATADVTVTPVTDVAVLLTGPNTVAAGSLATYTVTTTNNGPVTATGVVTAVSIPAGLSGVTVSGGGTYNATTGAVSFPATASLLNGNSVSNTITYTMPNLATFANVASVTSTTADNLLANNTATVTTATEPLVDATVTLSGPATIVQGNQVDYVVSATNNGSAPASNVAIRVQLPVGLTGVVGTNGSYNSTTGVFTFATIASQLAGTDGTVSYVVRFTAPATLTSLNASASVSTASEETSYTNNVSTIATTATPATTGTTDLRILLTPSTTTPVAGQPLTLTVSTTNLNNASTTVAATNVIQRVTLEPGLPIASVTITNGGTYDAVTGVVTFPAVASIAIGASVANTIVLTTPGMTPYTVRGLVTGDQTDAVPGNNNTFADLVVTQRADVTTALSGPATAQPGDLVTYSVVTLNNGPSVATSVVQTVTLPAGATNVVVSGGGIYNAGTGVVTFPTISSQVAGANGQVVNTISFNNPATFTTSYNVVANVTTTSTETNTANNAATFTTTKGNRAPVANAVTNVLQGPEGNTAGPLLISSLSGTDADGNNTIASYTITTIPDVAKQGTLSLNGTAVTVNQVIAVADIANLKFDPLGTFTGNAFFTYTVLDNAGAVSAPAVYTIPVGQDISSAYTNTPVKGGTTANGFTKYAANDVIAFVSDANTAQYNSTGQLYNATTGALASGAFNGLTSATTDAVGTALLASQGLVLNAVTGLITVGDPTKLKAGTYTVEVTTVDVNGGTNIVPVTYTIGARPLPVELTAFTATAKNLDAQLAWNTASEKNSDHFNVERSLNGTDFVKIDEVKGQGTSTSATDYARTDVGIGAKADGLVYYRLKQVDTDGTSSYSPVRTVRFGKVVPAIALFPNPATTATNLDLTALPAGSYQVSVLDATGRVVLFTTLDAGLTHALQLNTIASGSYVLLVRGANGGQVVNLTKRLIKE
ncbi:T9SS type A sorting domain-containing protein [Hymenobacter sp. UYCo722]|uniref:T9SS type A sorting domain-containing protein n=1 Tax=Hymenobacter sp. UYCo722 TaxID=3156335 RepID=UPI003391A687